MSKQVKTTLIIISIVVVLAGLGVLTYFTTRIPMNPPGTVGNTAGNLNNGGLFCEYDGTVYFSVHKNGGGLLTMNPDESNVRRLTNQKAVNILAGGSYLYYFQTGAATTNESGLWQMQGVTSFNRCKLNGKDSTVMTTDTVVKGQLVNNYLYLLTVSNTAISFYKVRIDNTDRVDLADYDINPASAENGMIYYSGTETNHYLYTLNTANDATNEFWRGNVWYPIKQGDYVYYMDVANNYRLCRYSISQNGIEVLTQDRVDCFNVGNGYIYYQKNSATDPQLICMQLNGANPFTVAYGDYTNINMTSRYVYFQSFDDDDTIYHALLGSSSYSVFNPVVQ